MNAPKVGLWVASVVFGLMSLAQLARLVIQPQILVNGYEMPLWPSGLALAFMVALAFWLGRLASTSAR